MPVKRVFVTKALTRRVISCALPISFLPTPGLQRDARPATWAQRVDMNRVDLPNFYHVTDRLYRSVQPNAEGFRALQDMGVMSVLSLRQTLDDGPLAQKTDLALFRVPIKSRYVAEKNGHGWCR